MKKISKFLFTPAILLAVAVIIPGLAIAVTTPSLAVTLGVNPFSGPGPLITTLKAQVSGTAQGTINYTFWTNCNSTCSSVVECTNACGAHQFKFDGRSEVEYSTDATYTSAGIYYPKVVVERASLSAEAKRLVIVTSSSVCEIPAGAYTVTLKLAGVTTGSIAFCDKVQTKCVAVGGGILAPVALVPFQFTLASPITKQITIKKSTNLAEICTQKPDLVICKYCGTKIPNCSQVKIAYSFKGKTTCKENYYQATGGGWFSMNYYQDTPEKFSFIFAARAGVGNAKLSK